MAGHTSSLAGTLLLVMSLMLASAGVIRLLANCVNDCSLGGYTIKDRGPYLARITPAGKATWSKHLLPRDGTLMELDSKGGVYLAREEVLSGALGLDKFTP